jgi:hypothetical protein
MAVRAAHIAFRDLGQESRPAASADHRADRVDLLGPIAMIELKDGRICFPAVDAWM